MMIVTQCYTVLTLVYEHVILIVTKFKKPQISLKINSQKLKYNSETDMKKCVASLIKIKSKLKSKYWLMYHIGTYMFLVITNYHS